MALVSFIIGLFLGAAIGMVALALAVAAGHNDRRELERGGWRDGNDD